MAPAYEPSTVEPAWSARWEEAGLFRAEARSSRPHYSIALPPPNITGELHMGHATNQSIQDAFARYKRMTGHEVLFLPGTDHAAIATQNVIEKQLAREGTTKEELGREAFQRRVDAWYASVGAEIISQSRELGSSLDLSRLRFTMDQGYVRAVRHAFVEFYKQGWIYQGARIVNWCPRCRSAISDLEVQWKPREDTLYYVRYLPAEGEGEGVVIATVRPETMLGDSGVAVHPDDQRYRAMVGREVILPVVGRRLRVVADEAVQRDFGSGGLKVTPGHDPLDYELGARHGFEILSIMHPDGTINTPELPEFDGLSAAAARELMVSRLRELGQLVRTEPYSHEVGHCDRCGAVIEPLISEQWFLSMKELAAKAIEASRQGRVSWHPERYERTYLDWLSGLRDWCVSRQLWLGHRIPIYHCGAGHRFASTEEPESCPECGDTTLEQVPDVLDTWFSSALWPFATLGWPEPTEDLAAFYPTSLNVTSREIINLWVSRMIMTGLHFMGEVPFHDVVIHATIQAADGRRMSKSLGTGVDPREMIRKHGADAMRAWCASVAMSSQDVRFDESRIEGFHRFANKLWNAERLVLRHLGEDPRAALAEPVPARLEDRWILGRLDQLVATVTSGIDGYHFSVAVNGIYDFVWSEFCDWYLEAVKHRLREGDLEARRTCLTVLDTACRLLHPFMPFVSDELWSRLPGERDFLVRVPWPVPRGWDSGDTGRFGVVQEVVGEIRHVLQTAGVRRGRLRFEPGSSLDAEQRALVGVLAPVTTDPGDGSGATVKTLASTAAVVEFEAPGGDATVQRLARLRTELEQLTGRLGNPGFRERAPREVVEKVTARVEELSQAIRRLES